MKVRCVFTQYSFFLSLFLVPLPVTQATPDPLSLQLQQVEFVETPLLCPTPGGGESRMLKASATSAPDFNPGDWVSLRGVLNGRSKVID